MEERGLLKSWNDDKGFGFIRPQQGGAEVFAHISAFHGSGRPQQGQQLLFVRGEDERGRPRATHMRREALEVDQREHRRRRKDTPRPADAGGIHHLPGKALLLATLCLLPLYGSLAMWREQGLPWLPLGYALLSLLSILQYWGDKSSARNGGWRTRESTLQLTALLGGWPGALVAQQVFRHKTRKLSFLLPFWGIVLLHQLFWIDWLFLDSLLLQRFRG